MNTPTSTRPPRGAFIVFLVLLISAVAAGVTLDRMYLMRTGRLGVSGMPSTPPLSRPTAEQQDAIFSALQRELKLRDDQLPAVRRIIALQITHLEQLRETLRPQLDSIFEVTRDSLDLVLDANQRARRDALLERLAPMTDSAGLRRR